MAKREHAGSKPKVVEDEGPLLSADWPVPVAAALGSPIRIRGMEREIRARLPFQYRTRLSVEADRFVLRMPEDHAEEFASMSAIVGEVLAGAASLPVLPSEAEEILTITPRERLKWTKDGRLQSAGTRTVKMRGRAKSVTFHVHDPRHVEDMLDRDMPTIWRQEDEEAKAENRKFGAGKAARTRAGKGEPRLPKLRNGAGGRDDARPYIAGWAEFEAAGLLR